MRNASRLALISFVSPRRTRSVLITRDTLLLPLLGWVALGACPQPASALARNTVTTLTVSEPGGAAPHAVTLQATVTANGNPVSPGIVTFCDASTRPCLDLAVLGTASVTSNGTATLKKVFAPGVHTIYAVFNRTVAAGRSESMIESVTVTGEVQTTARIGKTNTGTSVAVQAGVSTVSAAPLAGTASLVLDSNSTVLGTAPITRAAIGAGFGPLSTSTYAYPGFDQAGNLSNVVADFNGDGLPDFAYDLAGGADQEHEGRGAIAIQLNDPKNPGHFLDGGIVPSVGPTLHIVAGDFNGDGVIDLVWGALTGFDTPSVDLIALGDRANPGHFLPATQITGLPATQNGGIYPTVLAAADFNGDGLPDLLVNQLQVYFNNPFHPGLFYGPFSLVSRLTQYFGASIADLNQDGLPDLLLKNETDSGTEFDVLLNDPSHPGTLLPPIVSSSDPYLAYFDVAIADFNRDGLPDIAAQVYNKAAYNRGDYTKHLVVFLNNRASPGQFAAASDNSLEGLNLGFSGRVLTGNFHSNRSLDILLDSGYVLSSDPAHPGQFLPAKALPSLIGPPPAGVENYVYNYAAPDLNQDGYSDVVASTRYSNAPVTLGSVLTQVSQTSTAAFPSIALDGMHPELAHVEFDGSENFLPSKSCSIDLSTPIAHPPSLTGVTATPISSTAESVSAMGTGLTQSVSYGLTDTLGTTVKATAPGAAVTLDGLKPNTTYYYQVTTASYASGCVPLVTTSSIANFHTQP